VNVEIVALFGKVWISQRLEANALVRLISLSVHGFLELNMYMHMHTLICVGWSRKHNSEMHHLTAIQQLQVLGFLNSFSFFLDTESCFAGLIPD
jgi:hypothetical protein